MKPSNDITKAIYIITFCLLFTYFKDVDIFSASNKLFVSGILGSIGAAFGFLMYQSINKTSLLIKYIILIVLIVSAFLVIHQSTNYKRKTELSSSITNIASDLKNKLDSIDSVTKHQIEALKYKPMDTSQVYIWNLTPVQRKNLITCNICGYKALDHDSAYCFLCKSSVFDSSVYKLNEKKDWLKKEQLFYFSVDDVKEKIHFYSPKIKNGFIKDLLWKPSVTENEVKQYNKELNN